MPSGSKLKEFCKRGHLLSETRQKTKIGSRCGKCRYDYTREFIKKFRSRYKDQQFNSRMKRVYGLLPGDYKDLLNKQDNKCAICSAAFPDRQAVRVDHNHCTNKVRGLLCHNCNVSLGLLKENTNTLVKMISYLGVPYL